MEENTPGYIFSKAKKGAKIILKESEKEVKCTIENFKFSAHSRREGIIKIAEKLKPEETILVHGDPPAIDWVGKTLLTKFKGMKVYSAEIGKEIIFED